MEPSTSVKRNVTVPVGRSERATTRASIRSLERAAPTWPAAAWDDTRLGVMGMVQSDTTTWQGVTRHELGQAARNHGMQLEGLRYDVTPIGMHPLIHWDIPAADEMAWTVDVDGLVDHPLVPDGRHPLTTAAVTRPVTMECAGNGRR